MSEEPAINKVRSVAEAIIWQADHAEKAGAPNTARLVRALLAVAQTDTAIGRRIANWQGLTLEHAMPLRIAGGFHWLYLTGDEPRLGEIYQGLITDQGRVDALATETARTFDHVLLPWFDSPPQTNEAGRSASIMAALLWLSDKVQPAFELNEIGASAGINTMMGRFRFDLGGVKVGPGLSSILIEPEWRGDPPPANSAEVVEAKGCDIMPVDLMDEAAALRLKAYIWPEATARMARMDAAIAMAGRAPPELVRQDAAQFVTERLAEPQPDGVTRVLFHTIMWQYLPEATRNAITQAMEAAGALATADKPLAWISLETNRETFRHECRVRYWPGGDREAHLGNAHPHGAWVEWIGAD